MGQATIAFVFACTICLPQQVRAQVEVFSYKGMCDASAAFALDADHFIVGNDERNKLRIYKRGQPGPLEPGIELSTFLGTKIDKESDIEGSAAIGNRIYWITSHGRNKNAEFQERRHRFFATDIQPGQPPSVSIVGSKPYTKLLSDMLAADQIKPYKLSDAEKLAPKAPGGLNIEGLAATPDGKLLIGFRNPVPQDGALVVPLENPNELLEGKAAKFGQPFLLKNLKGNGIRSMERIGSSYLVVAGPPAESGSFALYRWSGNPADAATPIESIDFKDLHPEALFAVSNDAVQILSDDGEVNDCKDQDEAKQSFRSIVVKP